MGLRNNTVSASAVSGVATVGVNGQHSPMQITSVPTSASGTGTVTARPINGTGFESVFDSSGAALTFDLSAQYTFIVDGLFKDIKVTSSNSGDTFTLYAGS